MFTVTVITPAQSGKSKCHICGLRYHTGDIRVGDMGGDYQRASHAHYKCIQVLATKAVASLAISDIN
jgi:hypothetical protein